MEQIAHINSYTAVDDSWNRDVSKPQFPVDADLTRPRFASVRESGVDAYAGAADASAGGGEPAREVQGQDRSGCVAVQSISATTEPVGSPFRL